jgi:hypothetical protein
MADDKAAVEAVPKKSDVEATAQVAAEVVEPSPAGGEEESDGGGDGSGDEDEEGSSGEEEEEDEEEEEEDDAAGAIGGADDLLDPLYLVRDSAAYIKSHATHVRVDLAAVRAVAAQWAESGLDKCCPVFDRTLHFVDEHQPALTAQYLFVLDTLNWCFWPDAEGARACVARLRAAHTARTHTHGYMPPAFPHLTAARARAALSCRRAQPLRGVRVRQPGWRPEGCG